MYSLEALFCFIQIIPLFNINQPLGFIYKWA